MKKYKVIQLPNGEEHQIQPMTNTINERLGLAIVIFQDITLNQQIVGTFKFNKGEYIYAPELEGTYEKRDFHKDSKMISTDYIPSVIPSTETASLEVKEEVKEDIPQENRQQFKKNEPIKFVIPDFLKEFVSKPDSMIPIYIHNDHMYLDSVNLGLVDFAFGRQTIVYGDKTLFEISPKDESKLNKKHETCYEKLVPKTTVVKIDVIQKETEDGIKYYVDGKYSVSLFHKAIDKETGLCEVTLEEIDQYTSGEKQLNDLVTIKYEATILPLEVKKEEKQTEVKVPVIPFAVSKEEKQEETTTQEDVETIVKDNIESNMKNVIVLPVEVKGKTYYFIDQEYYEEFFDAKTVTIDYKGKKISAVNAGQIRALKINPLVELSVATKVGSSVQKVVESRTPEQNKKNGL